MSKTKKIIFWALFGFVLALLSLIMIFYLDLANGPLVLLPIFISSICAVIILTILLRKKRFVFKMIPSIAFMLTFFMMFALAKPAVRSWSAVNYNNPTKTEVLKLENGNVQGVKNKEGDVEVYAGIPYAEAPIGDLRWKEPVPKKNWEGVLDCSYFAPQSMQPDANPVMNSLVDIYASKGWHPDYTMHPLQNTSEDSLYLNIWRPVGEISNLPILMFIHGGSLTTGSSAFSDYNGEEMAKKGVIMITITYRLGVFGYFAHEDLIKESPNHTTGNYGLLDQIEALKWVKRNATYFGGDPDNITIAGESAGSSSVSAICTSPLAGDHLFKRAIGESSSLVIKRPPHTYRKLNDALETGEKIMKEFNCKSIDELRKVSAKDLVNTKYDNSGMTIDGYALNDLPYNVYKLKQNNEEALLNGYNVLESDAFVIPQNLFSPTNKNNIYERLCGVFDEKAAKEIVELYKDKIEKDAFSAFNEIFSVYWFILPHDSWSRIASENGEDVYRYQFTKENHYLGTYHSGEMIYAYGNVEKSPYKYRYDDSDIALSKKMLQYWANFAKNGNPNCDCIAEKWDKYDPNKNLVMELGSNVGPINDNYLDLYKILNDFIERQI